jgi:hypothetical protein
MFIKCGLFFIVSLSSIMKGAQKGHGSASPFGPAQALSVAIRLSL